VVNRCRIGVVAAVSLWVGLAAACGDDAGGSPSFDAPSLTAPATTKFVSQASAAPRTTPPAKLTTTTTTMPLPAGFPTDLPVPGGDVGYYTGSPELGFHLEVSTPLSYSELVGFFTGAIENNPVWTMQVRDIGRGFLGGFENLWAIYTAADHVLTQITGRDYEGVIEVEGGDVNILLDPALQPEEGVEPAALPPPDELPRPQTELISAVYHSGLIELAYTAGPGAFAALVTEYRLLRWSELAVKGFEDPGMGSAVGDLFSWRVSIVYAPEAGTVTIEFENRDLSYP